MAVGERDSFSYFIEIAEAGSQFVEGPASITNSGSAMFASSSRLTLVERVVACFPTQIEGLASQDDEHGAGHTQTGIERTELIGTPFQQVEQEHCRCEYESGKDRSPRDELEGLVENPSGALQSNFI
jgi:hypothetical protein